MRLVHLSVRLSLRLSCTILITKLENKTRTRTEIGANVLQSRSIAGVPIFRSKGHKSFIRLITKIFRAGLTFRRATCHGTTGGGVTALPQVEPC